MVEYTVFWDYMGADGWAKVTSMHRSPHRLGAEAVALGVTVDVTEEPKRDGWITTGWVNPATLTFEWRMTRDSRYRIPISEYMAQLPAGTRVQARMARASNPAIDDFMLLLEMAAQEATGINPHGAASREGLGYLVSINMMTQAEADAISDAAND